MANTKQKTHTQLLFICGWKVPNSDTDIAVAYLRALPRCGHLRHVQQRGKTYGIVRGHRAASHTHMVTHARDGAGWGGSEGERATQRACLERGNMATPSV